jgi:hypothetical protein
MDAVQRLDILLIPHARRAHGKLLQQKVRLLIVTEIVATKQLRATASWTGVSLPHVKRLDMRCGYG